MSIDAVQPDRGRVRLPGGAGEMPPLPERLPGDPMPILKTWYEAGLSAKATANPDAMTVATIDPDGTPSARIVLCRKVVPDPGYIVFFTNYTSRKSKALSANPRCAAVFHWDAFDRQARLECKAVRATEAESDAYFASRNAAKRLGAWASRQSEPIAGRAALLEQVAAAAARFGIDPNRIDELPNDAIPRPPHWGGWRLWPTAVELWVGDAARLHDRARWTRELKPAKDGGFTAGAWSATRLQP